MTMGETTIKVQPSPPPETMNSSDPAQTSSYDLITIQRQSFEGAQVGSDLARENAISLHINLELKDDLLTLIDSGASDHCFADKSMFTTYRPLKQPSEGLSAERNSMFSIVGKGDIELHTFVEERRQRIILENVLHTPELRSNLISVSKLGQKGASVNFDGDEAVVRLLDGTKAMFAAKIGRLYMVKVSYSTPETFMAQSSHKAVTFDTWHYRLAHAGAETIKEMISKSLVDGINTYGDLKLQGQCEDCIYGKHSTRPYAKNRFREREVLE